MKRTDLVDHITDQTGMSQEAAKRAVHAVLHGIRKGLRDDGVVTLAGFGFRKSRSLSLELLLREERLQKKKAHAFGVSPSYRSQKIICVDGPGPLPQRDRPAVGRSAPG